jgi:hypothetical protein
MNFTKKICRKENFNILNNHKLCNLNSSKTAYEMIDFFNAALNMKYCNFVIPKFCVVLGI